MPTIDAREHLVAEATYRKGPFLPSASAGGGIALAPCRCLAPVREGSWSTLPTESCWGVPTPVGNSTSGPWDSVRAARRLHNSPGLRPRTNPSTRRRAGPAGHRQGATGAGFGLARPVDGPPETAPTGGAFVPRSRKPLRGSRSEPLGFSRGSLRKGSSVLKYAIQHR